MLKANEEQPNSFSVDNINIGAIDTSGGGNIYGLHVQIGDEFISLSPSTTLQQISRMVCYQIQVIAEYLWLNQHPRIP